MAIYVERPHKTPGVYIQTQVTPPRPAFRTGVPVFLGQGGEDVVMPEPAPPADETQDFVRWQFEPQSVQNMAEFQDFCQAQGPHSRLALRPGQMASKGRVPTPASRLAQNSFLTQAVRGFFANGGRRCYVALYGQKDGLKQALARLALLDEVDLICAPDVMLPLRGQAELDQTLIDRAVDQQRQVLTHCQERGDRFAILDSLPTAITEDVKRQRNRLKDDNGALYFPWIDVGERDDQGKPVYIPPSGHVAGIYAATDARVGVHKAPANEVVAEAIDLQVRVDDAIQDELNPNNINCLRSFPGRGIRVWGARTLSSPPSAWQYVSVRRVFLTAARWIEQHLADMAFAPNDTRLWLRIERELTVYFTGLFRAGALMGATAEESFYVKCNAEINPQELRDAGKVVAEIGLAPALPAEFIIVQVTLDSSGVTITGAE